MRCYWDASGLAYSDVRLVWQVPGANPLGPGKPGEGKAPTILENCELPGLQSLSGNNTGWTTRAFTAQRYKDDYCGPMAMPSPPPLLRSVLLGL